MVAQALMRGGSTIRSRGRGLAALVGAVAVSVAVSLSLADAASEVTVNRFAGADRFETASLIAKDTFDSASTALIARADQFPDALAGNYLAGDANAPILLSGVASVPAMTKQTLADLKVKNVVLLGGPAALSPAVEEDLKSTDSTASGGGKLSVRRIGGADRYETARLIAKDVAAAPGTVDGKKAALLATGERFPDALAAGPASYGAALPTILTAQATLSPSAKTALTELGIEKVLILGGTAAVSQATEDAAEAATGGPATRIFGLDRTETARKVADFGIAELGFATDHANLARGDQFPDALAGGAHAGEESKAPILLARDPTTLGASTKAFFTDHNATISSIDVLGGPAAISDAVVQEAKDASTCAAPSTTTTSGPTTTTTPGATTTTSPLPIPTITTTTTSPATTTSTTEPVASTTTSPGPTTTTAAGACTSPSGSTTTTTGSGGTTTTASGGTTTTAGLPIPTTTTTAAPTTTTTQVP